MTSRAEPLRALLEHEVFDEISEAAAHTSSRSWTPEHFAGEQIKGLTQRIFLSSQPAFRQVVFSAVDPQTDIRELCTQVGQALTEHLQRVCIVDCLADRAYGGMTGEPTFSHGVSGAPRDSSRHLSGHLWMVPGELVWGSPDEVCSAQTVGRRLTQLKSEFDGCVIQAPPAGMSGAAGLLGRLSDGLILVLAANSTRKLAARKALTTIRAANARLLGTVLSERTFPIPERLYRWL